MDYKIGISNPKYKEQFENMFRPDELDTLGDRWRIGWRASQSLRYSFCINLLRKRAILDNIRPVILDIGCALGDFTEKLRKFYPNSQIWGIDISENAIKWASKMHPYIKFRVDFLPNLHFDRDSFDIITCLEVLYYLRQGDRIKSLENLQRILKPNGYLLFSGVLDGGVRYFAKDEIINLISNYFRILEIKYNYARLYTNIETKLLSLLSQCETIEKVLSLSDKDFFSWCNQRKNRQKVEVVKRFRNIFKKIPLSKKIISLQKSFLRFILKQKAPVKISYWLTRLILKERGQTRIIILAKNK